MVNNMQHVGLIKKRLLNRYLKKTQSSIDASETAHPKIK